MHNVYGQKYLHSSISIRPIATGISNQVPSLAICITNIGGGGGRSEEHSKFKHGTVIGCPLCNKSVCEIYFLLDIPQSTISGIIEKYKYLGTAAMKQKNI